MIKHDPVPVKAQPETRLDLNETKILETKANEIQVEVNAEHERKKHREDEEVVERVKLSEKELRRRAWRRFDRSSSSDGRKKRSRSRSSSSSSSSSLD